MKKNRESVKREAFACACEGSTGSKLIELISLQQINWGSQQLGMATALMSMFATCGDSTRHAA